MFMDADENNMSNLVNNTDCQLLSEHQWQTLAITRVVVALVCTAVCLFTFIVITCTMEWRNFLHRLILYLTVASLVYLVAYVAQVAVLLRDAVSPSTLHYVCTTVAFFDQWGAWLQLLFTAWITLYLSCKYWNPQMKMHQGVQEVSCMVLALVLPTGVALIPAVTHVYGMSRDGWCWLKDRDTECNINNKGVIEKWALWYTWVLLLEVFIPIPFAIALCYSYKMANQTKGTADRISKGYKRQAKAITVLLVLYLGIYFTMTTYELFISLHLIATKKYVFGMWIAFGIMSPVSATFLPVAFLVHIWCLGKMKRRRSFVHPTNLDLRSAQEEQSPILGGEAHY